MRMEWTRYRRACRLLLAIAGIAGLTACASSGGTKLPVVDYDSLMSSAEADVSASRFDAALGTFEDAAKADTTRKEPWVRSAQLYFDTGNYGRAIVSAQEVLQRDPGDTVAESVLTVAGFRVATQSLQRLQAGGALKSESAQHEARQLAAAMRSTLGPEIVADPTAVAERRTPPRRRAAPRSTDSAPPAAAAVEPAKPVQRPAANPFDKLGGN